MLKKIGRKSLGSFSARLSLKKECSFHFQTYLEQYKLGVIEFVSKGIANIHKYL